MIPTLLRGAAALTGALCLCATPAGQAATVPPTVSLLFAGDIVLDGAPGKWIADGKDPLARYAAILASTDIRIANLECVVATSGKPADKNFTFRAKPSTLPLLHHYFDAVSIANNHSGDFGKAAFVEMLGHLEQEQLPYFGGGRDLLAAHTPLIFERKGIRIALLGYDEFMPRSFEANTGAAGIAWSEEEQVVADIRRARTHYHADIVIPFMHWGWENEPTASPRQRALARSMIQAGADAVIGGHPHVTQDIEYVDGKPIIYSLGNFLMDSLDNDAQTHGWVLRLNISAKGVTAWDTRAADLDDEGIPAPSAQAVTPCAHGDGSVQQCSNRLTAFQPQH
ncbi:MULTISPECIES: CapA family protein [unclassified Undibacterium]|uniref:CapA family protein n=1 Tax=unclassified Undibacterium TaxID=2630295 RepID=UPI002AC91C37|nr:MULTISPECIES: CapA family protein [unclassified Undibacterium]MEB0140517.1 CapA family protein [Undibacterium sp. CCC2.1]MEB0173506.1 CapA family protein [Undibacterium sp. CCC1.1]MEB0177492.1 CapA family protein [Undibacterium sp. CCC3.4]MEB0216642.1 CapA family protein [Undibacterium sp. 5I2]WPX42359.1 CapA family protein [Undibacterium sp. CCC3.4]